jgi:hypothetical protein
MTDFRTAAVFALAAALTGAPALAEEPSADPRVGDQVDRICFGRDINNFRTIKGEDDAILLERGVNDWYKATLIGACNYSELKWAQAVAIDQRPAGGCVTPGDSLVFSRSAFGDFKFPNTTRCVISDIYKWDPNADADDADSADDDAAGDENDD